MSKKFFKRHLFILEIVVEFNCLIPLWEGPFKTFSSLQHLFEPELHVGVVSLEGLLLIVYFQVRAALVYIHHSWNEEVLALDIHVWWSLVEAHPVVAVHVIVAGVAGHLVHAGRIHPILLFLEVANLCE